MPLPKRQRSGDYDNGDEMDRFSEQSFTQQRHLIFEKLLSIENVNNDKISKLMQDVESLMLKVTELEKENVKLKAVINNLEQKNQSDSVILYGVPRSKEMSDLTVVKNIGKQLNVTVSENDVSDIFRLGPKPDEDDDEESDENTKCPPLVVKFTRKMMKNKFIKLRGRKKLTTADIGYENCRNRVYINEYLTKSNLELLKYSQKLKEFDIKYVWPAGGKILVKCEKGGTFSIDNKEHVDRLVKNRQSQRSSQ